MRKMGRKSIAEKLLGELPKADSFEKTMLVLYDFSKRKATGDFYTNLNRITEKTQDGSTLVQYSAYRTTSMKAAIAVSRLAKRYGADVQLYVVEETDAELLESELRAAQPEAEK